MAADLAVTRTYTLTPARGVHKLSTQVYGPLPEGKVGLIIGRSSSTIKGIFVHLGIIDSDYTGEIQIMVSVSQIYAGDRITQLLLLAYTPFATCNVKRTGGFGSAGNKVFWETVIQDAHPVFTLTIAGRQFEGLVDTGADVSIISLSQWPSDWPKAIVPIVLSGLGQAQCVYRSNNALECFGPDGQQASLSFYIVDITINLWVSDLHQFGAFLSIPHLTPNVKNIMLKMGYNPLPPVDSSTSLN